MLWGLSYGRSAAQEISTTASQQKRDSHRLQLRADSAHIFRRTFAKIFLKVENRYSFISEEQINLFGGMAGATFRDRHTVFAGYFFLDPRNNRPISFEGKAVNTRHYLDMSYFVLGYQYVVFNRRFLQLNVPVAIGLGNYKVEVKDENDRPLEARSGRIFPTNTGLQLIFKPIRWGGVSASGGYRFIGEQKNTELVLKGWYYSFGLWLDGRQVSRLLRYRHKKRLYSEAIAQLN